MKLHFPAICLAIAVSAWSLASAAPAKPSEAAPLESIKAPSIGERRPILVEVIESASAAEQARAREEKSEKHDAEDLDAQVRSAGAAERQVRINWISLVLSGIGALFLAWTLIETRRSAKAAVRVAELARAEFNSTHRPRIRVRQVLADPQLWSEGKVGVRCRIVNIGDTNAQVIEYGIGHLVTKEARELHPEPKYDCPPIQARHLKSGESLDLELQTLEIEERHLTGIRSSPPRFILFCFGYVGTWIPRVVSAQLRLQEF